MGKAGMFLANLHIFFRVGPKRIQVINLMAQQGFTLAVGIQARLGSIEFCGQLRDLRG